MLDERYSTPDGSSTFCKPLQDPSPETCDGVDNDLDGHADEGYPVGYPCSAGDCGGTGALACTEDGTGTTCVLDSAFALGDELCDGFDNDCNGLADEPWAAELGTSGVAGKGPCTTLGEVVCTADGTGTECVAVLPVSVAEELCNGVDDDCDGEIDEDFPGVGEPCSVAPAGAAPGACEVYGTIQCVGVHTATCATPTPAALEPEFCDGLDNDCDGQIDEGSLPGEGEVCGSYTGACEHGVLECVGGNLLCIGGTSPVEEVCNGLDDDCDGEADEGVPACGDTGATCQSDLECLTGVCILNRCT